MMHVKSHFSIILAILFASAMVGCAAPKTTVLKHLQSAPLDNLSITVACIRDVSDESFTAGWLNPEKKDIDLSDAAQLKLGHLLQDSCTNSKIRIIPNGEIPDDATELTCISMARKEGTDFVIHGEINHRASFTLNWLTWPSYIPLIVIAAPLWFPNYTLKGEVELTIHLVDSNSLERIFSRKISEEAYTSVCFLTRLTALMDRYTELEKDVGLHNAAIEILDRMFESIKNYEPGIENLEVKKFDKVIAVTDFQALSSFIERMGYGSTAAEMLTTAFENSGFFEVAERQRMRDVLAERNLSMTDLVQPEKAQQVAKLLGIDYLMVGSVAKVGKRLELNVRMLDISNGRIIISESDGVNRDADMQILIEQLARRIIRRFDKLQSSKGKE